MAREFRDEDRSKPVIAPAGITVGTISAVRGDRAMVTRSDDHDSLTDEIKDLLGWDDDEEESSREIHRDHIDRYEDDGVYLRPSE